MPFAHLLVFLPLSCLRHALLIRHPGRIATDCCAQIDNLEDLLKEKETQLEGSRIRLTQIQAHHSTSEGTLTSLEEAISDKDKQIAQLREQRDRAELEVREEKDLHEREIAEYKMKISSTEAESEKLQVNHSSNHL